MKYLSDSQQACLILASTGGTSKEIGPRLNLTYRTVDQYLNEAQHILASSSRREAARAFTAILSEERLKELQLKFPGLVGVSPLGPRIVSRPVRGRIGRAWNWIISAIGPPSLGGPSDDLTAKQKLFKTISAAFYIVIAIGSLVLLVDGAMTILS